MLAYLNDWAQGCYEAAGGSQTMGVLRNAFGSDPKTALNNMADCPNINDYFYQRATLDGMDKDEAFNVLGKFSDNRSSVFKGMVCEIVANAAPDPHKAILTDEEAKLWGEIETPHAALDLVSIALERMGE